MKVTTALPLALVALIVVGFGYYSHAYLPDTSTHADGTTVGQTDDEATAPRVSIEYCGG